MKPPEDREYVANDFSTGYPAGREYFYECTACGGVVPARPRDNMGCACGNLFIDVDAWRLVERTPGQLRVFRAAPKPSEGVGALRIKTDGAKRAGRPKPSK